MVFASMLFVFFFLTANLISQIVLKTPKAKNIAMLVFSMIFYSWGGPKYLFLLLATMASSRKRYRSGRQPGRGSSL